MICDTGSVSIHYLRTGGSKPPLILLHGLTGNGACWTPVARCLQSDFDVLMPDARGHGQSSAPQQGYGYEDHASDVTALIRELDLTEPVLVGHSMGGMTATVAAGQLGERIDALILVDPTFLTPQRQREVYESGVANQPRSLADLRARHPHRSAEMLQLLADARLQTSPHAFDVLIPPNPDYQFLITTLQIPILIVLGDKPVVSVDTARHLQTLNPRIRIEQIPNAGHGLPYDQPEHLAAVIRDSSLLSPERNL